MYNRMDCVFSQSYWLDSETFLYQFGYFVDNEGDEYHIEVEFHKDDSTWHFIKVYEDDNMSITDNCMSHDEKESIKKDMVKWMGT